MYTKLSEDELDFMEMWYDSVAMIENLIPTNPEAPWLWDEFKNCIKVRNYQFAFLSYFHLYTDDDKLTQRENFQRKKGAGDLINIAARGLGKTHSLWIDSILNIIHGEGQESVVSADCAEHLRKATRPISIFAEDHPFFKIFQKPGKGHGIKKGSQAEIETLTGHHFYAKNEKVGEPNPGEAFHGPHASYWSIDEFSYASVEGNEKRIDSVSSHGCVERLAGIPDLKVGSPLGMILTDVKKDPWICRVPQFISEDWDESAKARATELYGGQESSGYLLNVVADILPSAYGCYDMERVRGECLKIDKKIKTFEISKKDFHRFRETISIDRVPSDHITIASDIGTTGSPSEIIIVFGTEGKYKYRYNIPLFKLTTQEQAKVFEWLYHKLNGAFISLDCTEGSGRSIADELIILGVPDEHIIRCLFNSSVIIDFEKDETGAVKCDEKGNPLERKERVDDWSIHRLEYLFYNGLIEIPYQEKWLKQFDAMVRKNGKVGSKIGEDHLHQSFMCFAYAQWKKEKEQMLNIDRKKRCLGLF